jgi:hypothetical protein
MSPRGRVDARGSANATASAPRVPALATEHGRKTFRPLQKSCRGDIVGSILLAVRWFADRHLRQQLLTRRTMPTEWAYGAEVLQCSNFTRPRRPLVVYLTAAAHAHASSCVRPSPSRCVGEGVLRHRRPSPRALSRPKQGPDERTRRRSNVTVSGG